MFEFLQSYRLWDKKRLIAEEKKVFKEEVALAFGTERVHTAQHAGNRKKHFPALLKRLEMRSQVPPVIRRSDTGTPIALLHGQFHKDSAKRLTQQGEVWLSQQTAGLKSLEPGSQGWQGARLERQVLTPGSFRAAVNALL
ncbi:hypothetical protein CB1_001254019 [Camelus ferus]|nr:hypothetical protein CB1_001254019 [Camelus ferus]